MPIQAAIPFNPMIAAGGPDRGTPILNRMNALKQQRFENTMAEKASARADRQASAYEGQVEAQRRAQMQAQAAQNMKLLFAMAVRNPDPTGFVAKNSGVAAQLWDALGTGIENPDWTQMPPEAVAKMAETLGVPKDPGAIEFQDVPNQAGTQIVTQDGQYKGMIRPEKPTEPPKPGYGQPVRGVNPSTGQTELFVVDDYGNKRWLGVAPPPDKMSDEERKMEAAKERVSGNIDTMKMYYEELKKLGGAISSDQEKMQNVANYAKASDLGQRIGRATGSKEQAMRDNIRNMQPLLIQEIRQATQMGARGLDSNKELEFYLQAATDPQREISSNLAALQVLERAYGLGRNIGGFDFKEASKLANEYRSSLPKPPQEALDYLRENPDMIDAFAEKYGYRPDGY